MSSQSGSGQGTWQLKRVNSNTGPIGTVLSEALQSTSNVAGQTEILYASPQTSVKYKRNAETRDAGSRQNPDPSGILEKKTI